MTIPSRPEGASIGKRTASEVPRGALGQAAKPCGSLDVRAGVLGRVRARHHASSAGFTSQESRAGPDEIERERSFAGPELTGAVRSNSPRRGVFWRPALCIRRAEGLGWRSPAWLARRRSNQIDSAFGCSSGWPSRWAVLLLPAPGSYGGANR